MCVVLGSIVSTERRKIYRWLCNNSEIDNCGAWLFVHKVPFKLQEHVKTTKTDKSRFFFAKKILPDKQMFINVTFQSTKCGKKEFCVDIKLRETIGDVYCPTCSKCVYISTNEATSFYDCKKPAVSF